MRACPGCGRCVGRLYCLPCAARALWDDGPTIREGRVYVQHEPGCLDKPRNPRGCHCGRDHQ